MRHKTKITVLVTALIISVALLNIGFASFVFSNQAEKTFEANVSTEPVTDVSSIIDDVTTKLIGKDEGIHFGMPSGAKEDGWLQNWSDSEDEKYESLKYIRALEVSKNISRINIVFGVDEPAREPNGAPKKVDGEYIYDGKYDDTKKDFLTAVKEELIAAPTCIVSDDKDGSDSKYFELEQEESDLESENPFSFTLVRNTDYDYDPTLRETVVIYVTFNFGWGEHFDGKNPYLYYNAMDVDDIIEDAYTYPTDSNGMVTGGNIAPTKERAEARKDAYASLYRLDRLLNGLKYRYRFIGEVETDTQSGKA